MLRLPSIQQQSGETFGLPRSTVLARELDLNRKPFARLSLSFISPPQDTFHYIIIIPREPSSSTLKLRGNIAFSSQAFF